MRKLIGFMIFGGGLFAAWQFVQSAAHPPQASVASEAPANRGASSLSPAMSQATAPSSPASASPPAAQPGTPIATAASPQPRSFSPTSPLFATAGQEQPAAAPNGAPGSVRVTVVTEPSTTVVAPSPQPARRPSPGETAQRELVRDIQRELKRVGCYRGDASGQWGAATVNAMAAYLGSSNAKLPVDKPDVAFLALLKSTTADRACATGCGPGQVAAGAGICVPRPVLATRKNAPGASEPLPAAMTVGGPKTEAARDDAAVSPSVANPPPPSTATAAGKTSTAKAAAPHPRRAETAPPPQRKGNSSRYATRDVRDIFEHPLGR